MKSKFVPLLMVLLLAAVAVTQTGTTPDERTRAPRTQSTPAPRQKAEPAPTPATSPAVDSQEAQALRADIARMKVLLNQMRMNLAFVQTSESPLKHQFDLNNDMWQLLLTDMERRLQKIEQPKS